MVGHNAFGLAKIIDANGKIYLRFEDFTVTNGPDLRVYLTKGGDVNSGLHLAKLKGSNGDQNYSLEEVITPNTMLSLYIINHLVYFGQHLFNEFNAKQY